MVLDLGNMAPFTVVWFGLNVVEHWPTSGSYERFTWADWVVRKLGLPEQCLSKLLILVS